MAVHPEPAPGVGAATTPDRRVLRAVHDGLLEVDDRGSSPTPQALPRIVPPQSPKSSGTATVTGTPHASARTLVARRPPE